MAMVLTEIEKLDGRFPGLALAVKLWFDKGVKAADIPQRLQEQYGVSITETMAENFRSRRWAPEKQRVALKTETAKSAIEAFGGDTGYDAVVLAKLWELMDKMTIPQLLAARTLFIKIRAQNLKEQEFLYKTGQLRPGQTSDGQEADPQAQQRNVLQRIKEIFGLAGDEPPQPPIRQLPAATGAENA